MGVLWAREGRAGGGLVGQSADDQANNGARGDRGEDGVATVMVMHPVIAVWRIIQAPIVIIANDDRIGVVAIMPTDPIAWHIVAIIDEAKGRPRVIIEGSVTTPVKGARRIMPEIVPTIMMAIVIAIIVTAIIPVEIAVMAIMPIVAIIIVAVIIMPIVIVPVIIMPIASPVAVIMIAIMLPRADIGAGLRIAAIIGIATDLAVFMTIVRAPIRSAFRPTILTLFELAIVAAFGSTLLALFKLPIVTTLSPSFLTTLTAAIAGVAPEFAAGHAAFAAHAIIIVADIAAAFAALDPRLAIALLTGIIASIFAPVLRRELRFAIAICECDRRERARGQSNGRDAGCQF